jgi:hypothetical protein
MANWNHLRILCCVLLIAPFCCAQQPAASPQAKLLDYMTGDWVMQGTIGVKQTTHDVHVQWVLNREYLQLHEVSREKKASGEPAYEAIVYIGWDEKARQYGCLWLDSTGPWNFTAQGLAHANEAGSSIPFIFPVKPSEETHTTFSYDQKTDTWRWIIDEITSGKRDRFADLRLTRKT